MPQISQRPTTLRIGNSLRPALVGLPRLQYGCSSGLGCIPSTGRFVIYENWGFSGQTCTCPCMRIRCRAYGRSHKPVNHLIRVYPPAIALICERHPAQLKSFILAATQRCPPSMRSVTSGLAITWGNKFGSKLNPRSGSRLRNGFHQGYQSQSRSRLQSIGRESRNP